MKTITPVAWVLSKVKPNKKLAEALSIGQDAVCHWQDKKRNKRGLIPSVHHEAVLKYAKTHKLDIQVGDLVFGRTVK